MASPHDVLKTNRVSPDDVNDYQELIDSGREEQAVDGFIAKYVSPAVRAFQASVVTLLNRVAYEPLPEKEVVAVCFEIGAVSSQYEAVVTGVFTDFMRVFSKNIFSEYSITAPAVKKAILNNTLEIFNQKTAGALSSTNANVLSAIRKLQKDLMIRNMKIDQALESGTIINSEIGNFKSALTEEVRKMNPDFFRMLNEGTLIKSRPYGDGQVINYELENYADMSVRTTLLNVDRSAVEVKSSVDGRRVVEYYVRDDRSVKTERVICRHIMSEKLYGKSIVALDDEAAGILEVRSLSSAKGEGAFGPHCRHSIRPVEKEYWDRVEKALFLAEQEAV